MSPPRMPRSSSRLSVRLSKASSVVPMRRRRAESQFFRGGTINRAQCRAGVDEKCGRFSMDRRGQGETIEAAALELDRGVAVDAGQGSGG